MIFSSPEFIFFFLPLVVTFYFLFSRLVSFFSAKLFLIAASLFFYSYWNVSYFYIIAISVVFNYFIGEGIRSASKLGKVKKKKVMISFGIIANVSSLIYYKYYDFFIENINDIFGINISLLHLLLPLAISFFTFQQIAYLVDIYKEKCSKYNFADYSLFVLFFPQLIAGPIVHHNEMMPQFENKANRNLIIGNVILGLQIFSVGLFKKIVIADSFGTIADIGYANTISLDFYSSWMTSISYTLQLYYDFSGYSDMAVGIALLFNIVLPQNFNSPYRALSIQDFWRRWHMTLSRWLRDYVYIPLGGSKCKEAVVCRNLVLTFLIGGIWHGAGWTFIIWGLLHGIALVCHRQWQKSQRLQIPRVLAILITFMFVNITWVFFRAEDLSSAMDILQSMFNYTSSGSLSLTALIGDSYNQSIILKSLGALLNDNNDTLLITTGIILLLTFAKKRNAYDLLVEREQLSFRSCAFISVMIFISYAVTINASVPKFLYFNF